MTREEAYENLKDYLDNVFHNSNDYETYSYLRDCADTLAPPDPDLITGLVPCGGKMRIDIPPGNDSVRASTVVIDDSTSHITIGGGAGEQVKSIVKALRGLADALATLTE